VIPFCIHEGGCSCPPPDGASRALSGGRYADPPASAAPDRDALSARLDALALRPLADLLRACGLSLLAEAPSLALVAGLVSALEERTVEVLALRAASERVEALFEGGELPRAQRWLGPGELADVVGLVDESQLVAARTLLRAALGAR
jgi:hypothetical protein